MRTQLSPYPINFKDEAGTWKAIDTELKPAGNGELSPVAVDGDATIPSTLVSPVALEHDGREVSIKLRGATGARSRVGDQTARFVEALPQTDVQYQMRSLGIKETIVLKSASAPRTFTYDLAADRDLEASVEGGVVRLRTSDGKERFRVDAPLAWDSGTPASYSDIVDLSVEKVDDGQWVLHVTPDQAWLGSPSRVFPVSIDPDYYWYQPTLMRFNGAIDCTLESGTAANQNTCASTTLKATRKTTVAKPIFKFDIAGSIPSDATVGNAKFRAYAPGTVGRIDAGMRLRTLTSDWDSSATWNNRKSGVPWTTPGGDVASDPSLISPVSDVGYAGYYYYWDAPIAAVQRWVNGTLPNYGFQLDPEPYYDVNQGPYYFTATEFSNSSWWPVLDVTWTEPPPPSVEPASALTVGKACKVSASLALTCSGSAAASVSTTGAETDRLLVIDIDDVPLLPMSAAGDFQIQLPSAPTTPLSVSVWPVTKAELAAGQLNARPYGPGWPATSTPFSSLSAPSGQSTLAGGNGDARIRNYLFDGSGEPVALLLRAESGGATLCSALTSCQVKTTIPVETPAFSGEQAMWRQPTLSLPMGGRVSVNAGTGAVFLAPFVGPDRVISECLEVSPEFNSSEPTRVGSFGLGFEASVDQYELTRNGQGQTVARGPTGWRHRVDNAARGFAADTTGVQISDGPSGPHPSTNFTTPERTVRVQNPSTGQPGRVMDCTDSADDSRTTYALSGGRVATLTSASDSSTDRVSLVRDGSKRVVAQNGGLMPTTYSYVADRLSSVDLQDAGHFTIAWQTLGSTQLPQRIDYDSGESLVIMWAVGPSFPVATRVELRESGGAVTAALAFAGVGATRVLESPGTVTNAVSDPAGRIIGGNTAGPTFADKQMLADDEQPDDQPVQVLYDNSAAKVLVLGTASDTYGGVRSVALKTASGAQLATWERTCDGPRGCDEAFDLSYEPRSIATTLSIGQALELVATDGASLAATSAAVAVLDSEGPSPVDELAIADVEGEANEPTRDVTVTWANPEDDLNDVRRFRTRVGSGPWTAFASADEGSTKVEEIAVGGSLVLEFEATDQFGRVAPVQSKTFIVPSKTPDTEPLESSTEPEARGNPAGNATITVRQANGGEVVPFVMVSYESERYVEKPDGSVYRARHEGEARTDENGVAVVPELHDAPLTVSVGGATFPAGSGDQSRSINISLPNSEELATRSGIFEDFATTEKSKEEGRWCDKSPRRQRACIAIYGAFRKIGGGADEVAPGPVVGYWKYSYGKRRDRDSTKQNAMKHALWNGLVEHARRTQWGPGFGHYKLRDIQEFMAIHEHFANPSVKTRQATQMDLWNNARGRAYARNKDRFDFRQMCQSYVAWSRHQKYGVFETNSVRWRRGHAPRQKQLVYTVGGWARWKGERVKRGALPVKAPKDWKDRCNAREKPIDLHFWSLAEPAEPRTVRRARMTWTGDNIVTLMVWDSEGRALRVLQGQPLLNIPDVFDWQDGFRADTAHTVGTGPIAFEDRTGPGRTFTYGVCYSWGYGPAVVTLTLTDPNGTVRPITVTLAGEGSKAVVGQSPPTEASTAWSGDWCPTS